MRVACRDTGFRASTYPQTANLFIASKYWDTSNEKRCPFYTALRKLGTLFETTL